MARSQSSTWGGFELLDRQSVLIDDGGNRDELHPEIAAALQSAIGPQTPQGLRAFLTEILADAGIADMADLGGEPLTLIVQGILE